VWRIKARATASMIDSKLQKKYNLSIEGNTEASQTIVFAHGFGTDQTAWANVKKAFADEYRMILYDNIGGGSSDIEAFSPKKYSNLSVYANDALAIAEAFNLKDAIVIAHSVSSMVYLLAALKKPQHFSKMVFIGGSPRYLNEGDYLGGFTQEGLDSMYETMRTNYFAWVSGFSAAAMANPEKPELGEQFAYTLGAIRPDVALSVAKVIFESDVREKLPLIDKDILLVHALNDIAVPTEVANYMNTNIQRSELTFVNAEGHFPHISAPEEVISVIKEFIK
jgi:sigma-B regulation protein RsbQ